MPKGDRQRLKADPDDGTTPVSNLLLVALAISRLSGLEKGAMVYLWRQTYGWIDGKEKRRKERVIPLTEWSGALNTHRVNACKMLNSLEHQHVIKMKGLGKGKSISYSTNTHVSEWTCLDKQLLAKRLTPVNPTVNTTVKQMTNALLLKPLIPEDTNLASPKEILNKDTNKYIKESISTTPQEVEIVELLKSLPGWSYEEEADLEWLRELVKDYPNVEPLLIKGCRDYFSDKPTKKGSWKNRIRQWLQHDIKFQEKSAAVPKEVKENGYKPPPPAKPVTYIDGDTGKAEGQS